MGNDTQEWEINPRQRRHPPPIRNPVKSRESAMAASREEQIKIMAAAEARMQVHAELARERANAAEEQRRAVRDAQAQAQAQALERQAAAVAAAEKQFGAALLKERAERAALEERACAAESELAGLRNKFPLVRDGALKSENKRELMEAVGLNFGFGPGCGGGSDEAAQGGGGGGGEGGGLLVSIVDRRTVDEAAERLLVAVAAVAKREASARSPEISEVSRGHGTRGHPRLPSTSGGRARAGRHRARRARRRQAHATPRPHLGHTSARSRISAGLAATPRHHTSAAPRPHLGRTLGLTPRRVPAAGGRREAALPPRRRWRRRRLLRGGLRGRRASRSPAGRRVGWRCRSTR